MPHQETYEEWFDRVKLKEYYTQRLADPDPRDLPRPQFHFSNLYYQPKLSKVIKDILRQAAIAISRSDKVGLKKMLGPTVIPQLIVRNQRIHERYWRCIHAYRDLLFYQRVEYLFWSYQKKFFFDTALANIVIYEAQEVKDPKTGKTKIKKGKVSENGMRSLNKYKSEILPASYKDFVFDIDTYTQLLKDPNNGTMNNFLDQLIPHVKTEMHRNQKARKHASLATRHTLKKIMEIQALQLPQNYSLDDEEENELYPATLADKCDQFLSVPEKKLFTRFTLQLDHLLAQGIDIGIIGYTIQNSLVAQLEICSAIIREEAQDLDELEKLEAQVVEDFHDESIKKSGIADSSLEDENFYVIDETKKTRVPLLHLAMRVYADAIHDQDVQNAFECLELLIARGCSPYKRRSIKSSDDKVIGNTSAFEYAAIPPHAELMVCILRYTITSTPLAEKLRVVLFDYAKAIVNTSGKWRVGIFNPQKNNEEALGYISLLTTLLHTGEKYNDTQLLSAIKQVTDLKSSSAIQVKLKRLLNEVKDKVWMPVTPIEKKEMELKALSPTRRRISITPVSDEVKEDSDLGLGLESEDYSSRLCI